MFPRFRCVGVRLTVLVVKLRVIFVLVLGADGLHGRSGLVSNEGDDASFVCLSWDVFADADLKSWP